MNKLEWHTEKRKIKDLLPTENNPRKMTKEKSEQLEKSLKKFNLVEIPAINKNNKILAGHQRIKILKALGRENNEIEVRVPSRPLTEVEAKEYLIRSNKNTGEFDLELLTDFDEDMLADIGFDNLELDEIFPISLDEKDDEIPAPPKKAKSKLGDMFALGGKIKCPKCGKETDI